MATERKIYETIEAKVRVMHPDGNEEIVLKKDVDDHPESYESCVISDVPIYIDLLASIATEKNKDDEAYGLFVLTRGRRYRTYSSYTKDISENDELYVHYISMCTDGICPSTEGYDKKLVADIVKALIERGLSTTEAFSIIKNEVKFSKCTMAYIQSLESNARMEIAKMKQVL